MKRVEEDATLRKKIGCDLAGGSITIKGTRPEGQSRSDSSFSFISTGEGQERNFGWARGKLIAQTKTREFFLVHG